MKNEAVFLELDRATRHLAETCALAPAAHLRGAWTQLLPIDANLSELLRRADVCTMGSNHCFNQTERASHLRELADTLRAERDAARKGGSHG